MLLAIVVLVNGAFVPSSPPARRLFGHVMAPLAPIVARIAQQVSVDGGTVIVARGGLTCAFRVGSPAYQCNGTIRDAGVTPFARGDVVFLPLAAVGRAFGGSVTYDARRDIVSVNVPSLTTVTTPAPFDALAPRVEPTRVFTPQPAAPTPQAVESGEPRPRRTAIPATPSRVPGN
jgi:hypothetical protein